MGRRVNLNGVLEQKIVLGSPRGECGKSSHGGSGGGGGGTLTTNTVSLRLLFVYRRLVLVLFCLKVSTKTPITL